MNFLLGSSFFTGGPRNVPDLSKQWGQNLYKIDVEPSKVVIICEGGTDLCWYPLTPAMARHRHNAQVIHLDGDLGGWEDVMTDKKKNAHSGWSASVMTLALIAYMNYSDLIFKESDCFAAGPWVHQLYADMGDGDMAFGPPMKSAPWMASAQSLFIVRHSFLPQLVAALINMGPEKSEMQLGEQRFCRIREKFGEKKIRHLSFGSDRERPIQWDAPVFYAQQCTRAEIDEMYRRHIL